MKLTMRWYGEDDAITLDNLRQIPNLSGVVSAIYSVPVGEVWERPVIKALRDKIHEKGLEFEVVESVPVHEDIKLGKPTKDIYIDNYIQNIINLSEFGVKVICYNFMPVFDWTRSQLDKTLPDGSNALVYYKDQIAKMDPLSGDLALPGWDASYKKEEMAQLINEYKQLGEDGLWENVEYFLKRVIPVCEEYDVKMAIHPDDPPWPIFGLPRIITSEKNLDRFLKLYDSEYNGLTICTGSLGCSASNDMVKLSAKYAAINRIPFFHLRNVKILDDGSFEESAHYSGCGSFDMVAILKALYDNGFNGYIRPDHGRMIWGEKGRPGYGLYDRALGATYINGIWETLEKTSK